MTLAGHADVLPPSVVVGTCAVGPMGLALVVAIIILLRLHAHSDKRKRWKRTVAVLLGLLALSCVYAYWTDQQWHEERERRYFERASAREKAAMPDAAPASSGTQ